MSIRFQPMTIKYLLLDMDNTLYSATSSMYAEIDRRMTDFVADLLEIPHSEAAQIRIRYRDEYGSTLGGLIAVNGLADPERFLESVHPADVGRHLPQDADLRAVLSAIEIPKSVLTNSPSEHATRILQYYGIRDLFDRIFDIRYNGFVGKPATELYRKVLNAVGRPAAEVLFVDDLPLYLRGFQDLGGHVLLVREEVGETSTTNGFPTIQTIKQLPEYLESVLCPDPSSR